MYACCWMRDTKEKRLKGSERMRVQPKMFNLVFSLLSMQDPWKKQTAMGRVMGWSPELVTSVVITPSGRWIQRLQMTLKCHLLCGQSHLCWFNSKEQSHLYLPRKDLSGVVCDTQRSLDTKAKLHHTPRKQKKPWSMKAHHFYNQAVGICCCNIVGNWNKCFIANPEGACAMYNVCFCCLPFLLGISITITSSYHACLPSIHESSAL